ncbi:MAG: HAMP domain-containing histidine kinase, partial [Thermoproteota archaeon]|nr:HAMP domain-containing histidine kinase [Thermoproteota archaeon]
MPPVAATETTKIYYGEVDAMKIFLQAMANVKNEAAICSDANSPAFSMVIGPIKKEYIDFKQMGVKIRQIVEITKDNLQYCKELMNYVELRHMDNIKGNMAVSETEYVATAVSKGSTLLTQTIYSNVKAFLEQQRYFFENLWSKAIPAEQRIKELEEGTLPQRIETVYGQENTIQAILKFISETRQQLCVYANSSYPSVAMSVEPIVQVYHDFKQNRNSCARWITEVTSSNIGDIRKLMQFAQVRHLEGINGNAIAVNENECLTTINLKIGNHMPYGIINSVKGIVEQQRFTFQTLWEKAVPAEHRISEIEQGVEPQRISVIYDAHQALELYQSLIMSAEKEIKIVFPTANALIRQDKAGILFLLQEAASKKECQVKVLMPNDELIRSFIQNYSGISTRFFEQEERGKATILIVDNRAYLMMELKDDSKKTFHEAIGLSTYSNSKAGVLSYVSMFESLWKETELYEELKNNEKMQREFINIAAHELRTPMVPILGFSELLYSNVKEQPQQEEQQKEMLEMLKIILRNANRLHQLTEDILDVTRIGSNTLKLRKERFNLNGAILNIVEDYRKQIANGSVKVTYEQVNSTILVEADRRRLTQVISNLISNAIKFTKEGTVTVTTTMRRKDIDRDSDGEGGAEVIVSIKDTGTGIDPQFMPRLFTKFATKSYQGTGLGLYI